MRVALLHEYFPPQAPGGAEWSTLALAEQLAARGVEVSVVTADLTDADAAAETAALTKRLAGQGIVVERLPFARKMHGAPKVFPGYVFGNPFTERALAKRLSALSRKPDLLHVQGLGMLAPAHLAARRLGVPLVSTIRDYRALCPVAICLHREALPPAFCDYKRFAACTREYLQIYRLDLPWAAKLRYHLRRRLEWSARNRQIRALRDADATVFVSDATRAIYVAAGLTGRKPVVIHNQPPQIEAATPPQQLRQRWGLGEQAVLFVGRWSLGKGAQEMSAAWPEVVARHPGAQLVIAGRREAADRPQPETGAIFTGPLPHADVLGLMQLAALVVLPSRWPEPYSRVALEAMNAGRAIVATRTGGNPELVADGQSGLVVERGQPRALAAAIDRLLTDPESAERMGEAGRLRLQEELAGAAQLDKLLALYESLTTERKR